MKGDLTTKSSILIVAQAQQEILKIQFEVMLFALKRIGKGVEIIVNGELSVALSHLVA